ncbi:MAG: hypothetical protein J0I44_05370, partial [Microbacterium sp.]|nr:hypothetical protein [Microbacterium sp.]
DASGWRVSGLGTAAGADQPALSLRHLSLDLWLDDLRVVVTDATLGEHYALLSRQLRISLQGDRIRFGGSLRREGVAEASVRAVGDLRQDERSGKLWVSADAAHLKPLLDGLDLKGYGIEHGTRPELFEYHGVRDARREDRAWSAELLARFDRSSRLVRRRRQLQFGPHRVSRLQHRDLAHTWKLVR